jgi:hypothetical protein
VNIFAERITKKMVKSLTGGPDSTALLWREPACVRTCQATVSELLFCSLPRHPVTLASIRAAVKTQRAEDWFWRLVFVGVVCDFFYLGWLALRLLRAK